MPLAAPDSSRCVGMRRFCLAFAVIVSLHSEQAYGSGALRTDANILTALDVSDSIDEPAVALQFEGMARAVLAPEFLQAVSAGTHGRIGFAVYTWAAGRNLRIVLPWTLIGSADDARRVSGPFGRRGLGEATDPHRSPGRLGRAARLARVSHRHLGRRRTRSPIA
jgi:hypothetical protein